MILHCEICSSGGERLTSDSAIAIVDSKNLRLPLTGAMFLPMYPQRGQTRPWPDTFSWKDFNCPRHRGLIWAFSEAQMSEATKNGGPSRILTENGWTPVLTESAAEFQQKQEALRDDDGNYVCGSCGAKFAARIALAGHMRKHRR
jgi:hypothetical protein